MTNEEYIKRLPQNRLAQFLCDISNCETCEIRDRCGSKYPSGFYDWLEDTYNGNDITEEFCTSKYALHPMNYGVGDVGRVIKKL